MAVTGKMPRQNVNLDCGEYLVRTVTADDASDRWGRWSDDPDAAYMLNMQPKIHTKAEIATYVASFDQRTHLLLGVFKKDSGLLLSITRVDIDAKLRRCLVSVLVGEPDYRRKGVTKTCTPATRDYLFETLGLEMLLATALSHNLPVVNFLLKTGFHLDKKIEQHVKSRADAGMLDLCYFSLTREAWRQWRRANPVWPTMAPA